MLNTHDIAGEKHGRLTVIRRTTRGSNYAWRVLCRCECGEEKDVWLGHLRSGGTKSCGCLNKEKQSTLALRTCTTHGLSGHPLYQVWATMKDRCNNPNNQKYKYYGGRGIRVCVEWERDFVAFFNYVGERPAAGMSIDRINNDGNYEPGNVRWATQKEQIANRSTSKCN